jgi:hypothetical protein
MTCIIHTQAVCSGPPRISCRSSRDRYRFRPELGQVGRGGRGRHPAPRPRGPATLALKPTPSSKACQWWGWQESSVAAIVRKEIVNRSTRDGALAIRGWPEATTRSPGSGHPAALPHRGSSRPEDARFRSHPPGQKVPSPKGVVSTPDVDPRGAKAVDAFGSRVEGAPHPGRDVGQP